MVLWRSRAVLQYEPNHVQGVQFFPLIQSKIKLEQEGQNASDEANDENVETDSSSGSSATSSDESGGSGASSDNEDSDTASTTSQSSSTQSSVDLTAACDLLTTKEGPGPS